nr:MAG TPA: Single strand binding protein [Caudoviricetes sp.]
MNRVILMGRLTRDPEVRYTSGEKSMAIARYTLAVDRGFKRGGDSSEQTADFIPCIAFDKAGEFAEKYFRQGVRVLISGRIQTGSYTNKEGQKVYTTEVIIDTQEFADSKGASNNTGGYQGSSASSDGFMNIPDGVDDEGLPFN